MKGYVIALGFFDSLHIGHTDLIKRAKTLAAELDAEPIALTFDDNFFPALHRDAKQVYTLSEREELLAKEDIKAYVVKSGEEFFRETGKEFLDNLKDIGIKGIVAGEDFRYGRGAAWNINDLSDYCKENGIKLIVAHTVMMDGKKVSSGDIRQALAAGDIEKANALLGRVYTVSGEVARGRGEGSKMGIPTANIYPPAIKQLPDEGVYRTYTVVDGIKYRSLTCVGTQPTFDSYAFSVETLILDFESNIYGKNITVGFLSRMRDNVRFPSKEALIEQIARDIEEVKND